MAACAAEGYAQGKTATLFGPWDKMPRYQVISMVTRAARNYLPVQKLLTLWGQWRSDPGSTPLGRNTTDCWTGSIWDPLDRWGNMTRGGAAQVVA